MDTWKVIVLIILAVGFVHFAWANFLHPRYTHSSDGEGSFRQVRINDEEEEGKGWQILKVGFAIVSVLLFLFLIT